MIPSFEILLALGVVGFYLLDSTMLLYANELVYLHSRGQWRYVGAAAQWRLSGRYLYLPNLFTPDRAMFRVHWSTASAHESGEEGGESLPSLLAAADSLGYLMRLLGLLLLIVLPITLIVAGTGIAFLLVLGLVYLVITILLVKIYLRRAVFRLSGWSFAKLAFDSLACAPLALNLVRKITLRQALTRDPISFAHTRFDKATFSRLASMLNQWVSDQLAYEDESSPRYQVLSRYQKILAGKVT